LFAFGNINEIGLSLCINLINTLKIKIMNSNLKETANVYNMEPGTFRVDIFSSTMSFGGYAVSKDGTCVRINKNYKSESYARKVLKSFAGK